MSTATKTPPIRIRRVPSGAQPCPGSASATVPKPKGPPKPPAPAPAPVQPTAESKLKGPAQTPPKPRPLPVRVEHPRRLRAGRKQDRTEGGIFIASKLWGSPFRLREVEGRWSVVWTGDEMRLAEFKPDGWENIPCGSRPEAAAIALEAFRDWITSKSSAGLLDHARAILRGYNLVCFCPADYPCHGSILLELANQ